MFWFFSVCNIIQWPRHPTYSRTQCWPPYIRFELGDHLYVFGGFEACSVNADVAPSNRISQIHIESLRQGNVAVEVETIPVTFQSSYVLRTGLREALIFDIPTRSLWRFNDIPQSEEDLISEPKSSPESSDMAMEEVNMEHHDEQFDISVGNGNTDNLDPRVELTGIISESSSSSEDESEDDEDDCFEKPREMWIAQCYIIPLQGVSFLLWIVRQSSIPSQPGIVLNKGDLNYQTLWYNQGNSPANR